MPQIRQISKTLHARPTIEGAGVHLKRAFGYDEAPLCDPFLLLDYFSSNNPHDYILGFPWHPHRGIETVTYMLDGSMTHEDNMGNKGTINSGDVQWMTAGSGIIHQEMPQEFSGAMRGFQLWINLPRSHKMIHPRYQEIKKDRIPYIEYAPGIYARIIAGTLGSTMGPVEDIIASPSYFDISMEPDHTFELSVDPSLCIFAFVIDQSITIGDKKNQPITEETTAVLSNGDMLSIRSSNQGARFLLIMGKPLQEPIAWYGPIVMNTEEEIKKALDEYQHDQFVKS